MSPSQGRGSHHDHSSLPFFPRLNFDGGEKHDFWCSYSGTRSLGDKRRGGYGGKLGFKHAPAEDCIRPVLSLAGCGTSINGFRYRMTSDALYRCERMIVGSFREPLREDDCEIFQRIGRCKSEPVGFLFLSKNIVS
jgi:hypothetical protein